MVNPTSEQLNDLSHEIIGAALEVHKHLGPGLLETVYEDCMVVELQRRGIHVERQVQRPIIYKGANIGHPLVIDLLVESCVIVELKAVRDISDLHAAQLLSYLRLSDLKLGLLINFNCVRLQDGLKRIVNKL